jgi:hypothetical protein
LEKKVIRKIQHEVGSSLEVEASNNFSLNQKKYAVAMRQAEELLSGSDIYAFTIYDSLNCGKLARLINYITNGSACLLLCVIYIECVIY